MNEDDPPPSYDEIHSTNEFKPRTRSPYSATNLEPESFPLTGKRSRPHTPDPKPSAPSAPDDDDDAAGPGPSTSFNFSSSSAGGTHSARMGGRASPNVTFTNETSSGTRGTHRINPDGSTFFSFSTGDGPSTSRSGDAGQFFNSFFSGMGMSGMENMMGAGPPPPSRPTSRMVSLDRMVRDIPNSFRFEEGPEHSGNYEFFIRQSMDCLLVKGKVNKLNGITMTTAGGEEFLRITNATGKHTVKHRNTDIATLEVWTGNPQSLRVIRTYERKGLSVEFAGPKDIVITRPNRGGTLCKIYVSEPLSKTSLAFEGSLVISDSTTSVIETCICIAVAVVYMAERNELQMEAAKAAEAWDNAKMFAICVTLILFIVAMVIMVKVLSDRKAERNKKYYGS